MVKKLTTLLLLLALSLTFALADTQVQDDAGLFTADEIAEITDICNRIENTYQVDMFVLTSRNVPNGQTQQYADDYYDNHHFGFGDNHSGMIYLIDMSNHKCWISTCGDMIDYLTDEREEGIFDAGWDEMLDGEYGQSVILSLEQTSEYLAQGRQAGQFRYDEITGEAQTTPYMSVSTIGVVLATVCLLCLGGAFLW